ncbi:MAG: phasin family protein [Nitrospira sp.]|nr:phasin family protein [Nitrospira sp.]
MNINDFMHKALMAGIGIPEKINELVEDLVNKGELSESQGAKLVKECSEKVEQTGDDLSKTIADLINKANEKLNIPSKDDVEELNKKLKVLTARVKKLEQSVGEVQDQSN